MQLASLLLASSAVAALGLTVLARAADLPGREAVLGPPEAVEIRLDDWSGFYSGTFIGYQAARGRVRDPFGRADYDLDGVTGGRTIGHGFAFNTITLALEGEIGIDETKGTLAPGPTLGAQGDHLWQAGGRALVGYSFGRFRPFVSGGALVGQFHQHSLIASSDGDFATHLGYTVGAGLDVAITPSIVTRFEYLFADFGERTYVYGGVPNRTSFTTDTFRASLLLREVPGSGGGGRLSPGRSGFYGGASAGHADGRAEIVGLNQGPLTDIDVDGIQVGFFGGVDVPLAATGLDVLGLDNLGLGPWFVGFDSATQVLEATGPGVGQGASPSSVFDLSLLWSTSLRGRAGFTYGAVTPYLAGGLSVSQARTRELEAGGLNIDPVYGGTVAVGLDYAITDRWFIRGEYSYSIHPDVKAKLDGPRGPEIDRHDVRVGLGYRLGDSSAWDGLVKAITEPFGR